MGLAQDSGLSWGAADSLVLLASAHQTLDMLADSFSRSGNCVSSCNNKACSATVATIHRPCIHCTGSVVYQLQHLWLKAAHHGGHVARPPARHAACCVGCCTASGTIWIQPCHGSATSITQCPRLGSSKRPFQSLIMAIRVCCLSVSCGVFPNAVGNRRV